MPKTYEKHCIICGKQFIAKQKKTKSCSRSCANKLAYKNGRRRDWGLKKSLYEHWVEKYGTAEADRRSAAHRQALSIAIKNADMSHQKEVSAKIFAKMNRANAGKSFDERFGVEKSKEIRAKLSAKCQGENNPAYGKVYSKGGRSVKGYYRGVFFRSLLEYSFMKHLELSGLLLENIQYECFRIPWEKEGRKRTYKIDFYVPSQKIVYEVKMSWACTHADNQLKWEAARAFCSELGLTFKVMTENDFRKISFDEAMNDKDVKFIESSFKSFKRASETI